MFTLKVSEQKKVLKAAKKWNGDGNYEIVGYSCWEPKHNDNWADVTVQICKDDERVDDIKICCAMFDRRMSFVPSFYRNGIHYTI